MKIFRMKISLKVELIAMKKVFGKGGFMSI